MKIISLKNVKNNDSFCPHVFFHSRLSESSRNLLLFENFSFSYHLSAECFNDNVRINNKSVTSGHENVTEVG